LPRYKRPNKIRTDYRSWKVRWTTFAGKSEDHEASAEVGGRAT
jgi:hypothetical protein